MAHYNKPYHSSRGWGPRQNGPGNWQPAQPAYQDQRSWNPHQEYQDYEDPVDNHFNTDDQYHDENFFPEQPNWHGNYQMDPVDNRFNTDDQYHRENFLPEQPNWHGNFPMDPGDNHFNTDDQYHRENFLPEQPNWHGNYPMDPGDNHFNTDGQYHHHRENFLPEQPNWRRNYPSQAPKGNNQNYHCRPQRGGFYPRGNKRRFEPFRGHPFKKPKQEPVEGNRDCEISNQQTTPHEQASTHSVGNDETKFLTLAEQVQTKEPYWRSKHQVQDVWQAEVSDISSTIPKIEDREQPNALPTSEVDATISEIDMTANPAVNNSSPELPQDSNQEIIVDLTNGNEDEAVAINHILKQEEHDLGEELHDKQNQNTNGDVPVHSPDYTQNVLQISQTNETAATVSNTNLEVPKLILRRKSSATEGCWSVERSNLSNSESSVAANSPNTGVRANSSLTESNNFNPSDNNENTSSNSPISRDHISNQSSQNQVEEDEEILQREEHCENFVITASFLDMQDRVAADNAAPSGSREDNGPVVQQSASVLNNSVEMVLDNEPAQLSTLPLVSNSAERSNESDMSNCSERSYESDMSSSAERSNESTENVISNNDENIETPRDDPNSGDESDNSSASIVTGQFSNSDTDLSSDEDSSSDENSDSGLSMIVTQEDQEDSPALQEDSSSKKRKNQGDKLDVRATKKTKTNEGIDDVIVISSDDETYVQDVEKIVSISSALHSSLSPNTASKNVRLSSKIVTEKNPRKEINKNSSAHTSASNKEISRKRSSRSDSSASESHKSSTVKCTRRPEVKKPSIKNLKISNLEEKKNQNTSSSARKSAPIVHKVSSASNCPNKKEAPRSAVDRSAVLYGKDDLRQMKYFASFVDYYSARNFKVSLVSQVNNPADLCNNVVSFSKENECFLIQIKFLQNSESSQITYKTLSNAEFDIRTFYKYFLDFRKSTTKKLDRFIVFTNLDVNIVNFRKNGVEVRRGTNEYQFHVKENHELHNKFLKSLSLYNVAEKLAQSIQGKKQKNFNTEIIRKYHVALIKEKIVHVGTKKNSNGRSTRFAKFHNDFLRECALSHGAKELRRHLTTTFFPTGLEPSMSFELTNDSFGVDVYLDPNPEVDYEKVAEALMNRDQTKLLNVKSDLEKIVGHVLEKADSNVFTFSTKFFRGNDLPGNLKNLYVRINTLCKHKKINFFDFCKNTIYVIEDFCNDHPVHKLPKEDCKELFEEFYKCFTFENIENYSHRLNKNISRISDKACMNAVQEELLAGFKQENLNKETFISIKNLISKCKVKKQHVVSKINIQFDEKMINKFGESLLQHGINLCKTRCTLLMKLKVKQLVSNYLEETLFITNKTLLDMTNDVLNALEHKSTKLLVVLWDAPTEKTIESLDIFMKLLSLIKYQSERDCLKSVIVIAHQKDCSSLTSSFQNVITDDKNSFNLSEESRLKLLQAENISLQHRRLSLAASHLILDEHVSVLLESTEILQQLCSGKLSIGKDLLKPPGYKDPLFTTQIKQCIVVDPSIFHEQIEDVFVIRNIDRKDLERFLPPRQKISSVNDVPASMRMNARYILLGNITSTFFEDFAERNQDRSVHLLRYETASFVWEATRGNNKELLGNRIESVGDLLKCQRTENVIADGPKTVIICGESGSGKSVCLHNLARETKNLYKTETLDAYWPVQVNLDKARLSKHMKKDVNMAVERDFMPKFMCNYLELDEVQSKILTMIFHDQLKIKLALFFDNYEELPPTQRRFVVQLLQELQVSYCERIYVTSTPSTRSELEDGLAVFAYSLEFSEVEKVEFLQKLWSKSFGNVEFTNEAGNFIGFYGSNDDDDLTTTPLHLKMLAGLSDPKDDDYAGIEARDELYRLYVEHKDLADEESASLYSLRKILDDDQIRALDIRHKYPKKGFTLPDDLHHRTFYEYFTAKWLATRNHPAVAKCIDSLLNSVSPLFFKTYLAQLDAGSDDVVKVVGNFAANGQLNIVKTMLNDCKDKLLLSSVIQSDKPNARAVVRLLLDHYNDAGDEIMLHGEFKRSKYAEASVVKYVNRREGPRKETPLEVAARAKNVPVACELLLKGASAKCMRKEFALAVARYVADEMGKTDRAEWLHPIAEKLLKLRPDAVSHLNKTEEYPRLLSYFFVHGRVELVNLLLKNDRERYNVLVTRVDEKSPLDRVNESRRLSDDERLEITKYIVSNVGDELERRNKRYLGNVLIAAAENNHERTFEYFVGKYPGKHMGFLTSAMSSNRLDLMRFLMRKTDRMMYPNDNTALHMAVELGVSATTIKFLVNRGGIDNKNKLGETALCVAFKVGQDFELIKYLIKRDAHLFEKDELGLYPWCHAIVSESKYTAEEQRTIMRYLKEKTKLRAPETEQKISFDSDLKRKEVAKRLKFFQRDIIPNLALYIALRSNDESWIEFLVLHGANVNHKQDNGRMPLHVAVEFKKYKLAKTLLDHGAMFDARDNDGATPLSLLLASGDESRESREMRQLLETARQLFAGEGKYSSSQVARHVVNCRDERGRTLLHVAVVEGWGRSVVQRIIADSRRHAVENKDFPALDVNARDAKGQTPLMLVGRDNVDVAKELLASGAIFEPATTSLLRSAKNLIEAAKRNDPEEARKLIKNECLVNARDEFGKSCLHYAASLDCREIMEEILLRKTSDANAVDLDSQTPLHCAVESDNIACVVLLLKAGASYDARNKRGERSFDAADKANESAKLLRKIHEAFVDIKSDEPRILVNDNPDALVEYLADIQRTWSVSRDIVVNVVDAKKNTLLHVATRYDFISVVENLLKQGAIYNQRNGEKKTPDASAITSKHLFATLKRMTDKLSLSSWANADPEIVVNYRFNSGYNLLHSCVQAGKKEEVCWLIENGADAKATSRRGRKIVCDKKKYPEICELLDRQ